jgi:hypothetical protein
MTRKIFDIYNDVLRELDGTSIPKVTTVIESDYITLYPGTNDDIYQFYVDPALCGNVNVKFQMTNFATVAGEVPSGTGDGVYDPSDYVSSDSTLPWQMTTTNFYNSTQEKTIPASSTEDVTTVNISNIPYNYDHADILVQYTVKTDGEFDMNWDCDWSLSSQGSFPTNITPSDLIQSDNSDVDLDYIGTNTSIVHRFYIKAIPNARSGSTLPSSTITLKATNNLGTSVTIANAIIKPTFFHYADYPADGTLGGSSSFATDPGYPTGGTCYYVKSNGQIIAKIDPSVQYLVGTSITGHYLTVPFNNATVELIQTPDNRLIYTQSASNYLSLDDVNLWKSQNGDASWYYFGPVNAATVLSAIKQTTNITSSVSVVGSDTIITVYLYYKETAESKLWEEFYGGLDSWFNFVTPQYSPGHTRIYVNGYGLCGEYDFTGEDVSPVVYTFKRSDMSDYFKHQLDWNINLGEKFHDITEDFYLARSCGGTSFEEEYVTRKFVSSNCGKVSNWDGNETPTPDPDTDPDVFPTSPEGPSYMQYKLNDATEWIQINANSSLNYIEKTDTGTTPEDYDGTVDQFYIGYKNLNTISYYAPATIAVNCIVSYEQFKDTYVYGDYY